MCSIAWHLDFNAIVTNKDWPILWNITIRHKGAKVSSAKSFTVFSIRGYLYGTSSYVDPVIRNPYGISATSNVYCLLGNISSYYPHIPHYIHYSTVGGKDHPCVKNTSLYPSMRAPPPPFLLSFAFHISLIPNGWWMLLVCLYYYHPISSSEVVSAIISFVRNYPLSYK